MLGTDVFGKLLGRPTFSRIGRGRVKPRFDRRDHIRWIEGEDEILQDQDSPGRSIAAIRDRATAFQKSGRWCSALRV